MATKWIVALLAALVQAVAIAAVAVPTTEVVRLDGHVLPALAHATRIAGVPKAQMDSGATAEAPLTLTVVLKRDDEFGFQQYLRDVYDPTSPLFRKFLTPAQIAQRFGPSQQVHDETLAWLQAQGFELVEGSTSRMTLTLRGTRAAASAAFAVGIGEYTIGERRFYANDAEPALPAALAAHVQAIVGLSTLAQPQPMIADFEVALIKAFCSVTGFFGGIGDVWNYERGYLKQVARCIAGAAGGLGAGVLTAPDPPPPAWQGVDGIGQTVGVVAFDRYDPADVANWIAMNGMPAAKLGNVSRIAVAGGASAGANASEVLLDISLILSSAPGAMIEVYDAPTSSGGSYQAIFSAMISGGVTIISNSWAYCEDQTTLADVQSIESVLQTAAAAGISVVSAAGDHGTTCLDGSPNTAHVPASSPTITAVGGTSMTLGPGFTYGSETWWDSSNASPPGGQGGYMTSRFFARPTYQDAISAAPMRSLPDVSANADPAHGTMICQAAAGGCPNGMLYGGTSAAAPQWAAYVALLNQAQVANLGFLNPAFYARANTAAFHDAASMGSDFTHVGLGSPNLAKLHQSLTAQTTGAVDANVSIVEAYNATNFSMPAGVTDGLPIPANGTTKAYIVVRLADVMGNIVDGHTIAIAPAGNAVITPVNSVTSVANGAAIFAVTDLTVETLTFTATDTTSGTVLAQTAKVAFGVPAAASGSIVAFNPTVAADGVSTGTIQVTLQDALGRPTPGKQVVLNQTGSSVIVGSNPGTTDANGRIDFKVSNTVQQGVVYTAVDITDGSLPVPGSATVTFSAGGSDNCGTSNFGDPDGNITAAPGYAITPYATGFLPKVVAGNGIIAQCRGAYGLAFDASGNLFVSSASDGSIYKFPVGGGAVGASTLLTPTPLGPFMAGLTFDKTGKLYAAQFATGGGNVFTGAVIEVNATTGAYVRTVASSITCASFLTTDPASGDLFVDDSCGGGGSENGSLWRIANPGSATPTTSVYASTSSTNGGLSFAPGGTLYAIDYFGTGVAKVTGTASPTPGVLTPVHGITGPALDILALGNAGNGDAQTLIVSTAAQPGGLPAGMKMFDARSDPTVPAAMIVNNAYATVNLLGPDGCLYAGAYTTVYRITNADGSCPLRFNQPVLTLTPYTVAPNPAQGTAQPLTAAFHFASVPAGTAVYFQVSGANATFGMVRTNASGAATFTYTGYKPGNDTIVASATLADDTIVSNTARVTWTAGSHPTIVNLDLSPGTTDLGRATTVFATLVDATTDPAIPLVGQVIQFTAGAASCSGNTNAQGLASCVLTPTAAGGLTLTARFGGSAGLSASSASRQLVVLVPPAADVSPSPASLAFGSQVVATASAARSTTLTNTGGAPFTLGTIGIAGTNSTDFATTAGANACGNGQVLAAGNSCSIYVVFTPAALGSRAANLVVTHAGGGANITVPLSGTGTAPAAACYTGTLPGGGTATACVTGVLPACQFTHAAFVPVSSISTPPPANVTLPFDLFQFTATGCGSALTLTVQYPSALPAGTRYEKFGGTVADPTPHWYSLPATVSGSTLSVIIADGGNGDSDLAVNGSISDPGGAGVLAVPPPVDMVPVDTIDNFKLALLALMLAVLAARSLRRRR